MNNPTHDLIIIGGGPAGYVAAERAGAKGLRVLLVEKQQLGGVCLNCGCIPSKALLYAAKRFYEATHGAAYGLHAVSVQFDFSRAQAHKSQTMDTLRKGIQGLMKKYKVDVISGSATIRPDRAVVVGDAVYTSANILLATGSSPARPPIPGSDLPHVVDSTGILALETLPKQLVIVGGGIIGCEFACCFGSLGVPVTVIEMLPEICPTVDPDIAKILRAELERKNVTFHTGARVAAITAESVEFTVDGKPHQAPADCVLVATGRKPNVRGLGLEALHVDFDDRGVRIDDHCATNVPGLWAAGDVTGKTWLAHAASRMAEVVIHAITGQPDRMRYDAIAGVVYTTPEVATVGLTEAQAKARGLPVRTGKLPMGISGRFLAEHAEGRGQVKVVAHAETGVLLGVHMIGGACSEMIFGAAAMIETECRVAEIADLVFPHPTASEVIREAVLAMK
ncbi:MAG: dihydrolipoyl dehydrogenase [Verrucomicrobia bacterium]|nr:dihydrolipoyl dehydrogenase [Verrucomicrobiota bacterium]